MLATASMQLQHQLSPENLNHLLSQLPPSDRTYLQDLAKNIVTNYATPNFSLNDWHSLNQVFRFFILAKTSRCSMIVKREDQQQRAQDLCDRFTLDDTTLVMVFDLTVSTYVERAMCQNQYSFNLMGPILRNASHRGVDGSELYSVVLGVGAAFLTPGTSYCIYNQAHYCADGAVRRFDMNYYVDPTSFLCVVWGKLT